MKRILAIICGVTILIMTGSCKQGNEDDDSLETLLLLLLTSQVTVAVANGHSSDHSITVHSGSCSSSNTIQTPGNVAAGASLSFKVSQGTFYIGSDVSGTALCSSALTKTYPNLAVSCAIDGSNSSITCT